MINGSFLEMFHTHGRISRAFPSVLGPENEVTNPLLTRLSGDMVKNKKHEKD
jgi:hypothetical protein